MNYCPECGFKLDGNFNFCPNCGSKISLQFNDHSETSEQSAEIIICKNCGEENQAENLNCFSCGISLKGSVSKKQNKRKQGPEKNVNINSIGANANSDKNKVNQEKVLDNKKILVIAAAVFTIFVLALVFSGVFDSGIQTEVPKISNESSSTNNGSINLANMEEINQLETKVKENPDDLESTLHLAHMQQDAGLSEKAIANYEKYLSKFPEDADARVDLGICYYNLNNYDKAIKEMETAIKYQPKHQIAYLNLGIVNLTAKNLEASREWFKKTVELDPNSEAGKRAQELLHSH